MISRRLALTADETHFSLFLKTGSAIAGRAACDRFGQTQFKTARHTAQLQTAATPTTAIRYSPIPTMQATKPAASGGKDAKAAKKVVDIEGVPDAVWLCVPRIWI